MSLTSLKRYYIIILLICSVAMQTFFIFQTVPDDSRIYDLGFGFGGYVESITKYGEFKSCSTILENKEKKCLHSSRMPALPILVSIIGKFDYSQRVVSLLKSVLFHVIVVMFFWLLLRQKTILSMHKTKFIMALAVIYLSPMYAKHLAAIAYEEGYVYWLLPCFCSLFVICCHDLVYDDLERSAKNIIWPALFFLGTALFLFKSSLLLILMVIWVLMLVYILYNQKSRIVIFVFALNGLMIFGWGGHNYIESGRFSIMTSYDGENLYRGNNSNGLKIYPDVSLDRLFDSQYVKKSTGEIVIIDVQKSYGSFSSEWEWNDYYKYLAIDWIFKNPQLWFDFLIKKSHVFFIGLDFTPHKINAIAEDSSSSTLKNILVNLSLGIIRLMQVIFILFILYLAVFGRLKTKILVIAMLALTAAYSMPYLIGFGYERHVEGLLPILVIFNFFLLFHLKSIGLWKPQFESSSSAPPPLSASNLPDG